MSVNTADANRAAVLLHSGEYILVHSKDTTWEFCDNESPEFHGSKLGHTYLTSHRIVFRNRSEADLLSSLSVPFVTMRNVSLSSNIITGAVQPQPGGNFLGEAKFRLSFENGGATEFVQALMAAACVAIQEAGSCEFPLQAPPYKPSTAWYEASMSAYQRPEGYFDWIPKHEAFTAPRPNSVYITDDPPPYSGIGKECWQFEGEPLQDFSPMDGVFPRRKLVIQDGPRCAGDSVKTLG